MSRAAAHAIEMIAKKEGISAESVRKEIENAIKMAHSANKPWMKKDNAEKIISAMAYQAFAKRRIRK